MKFSLFSKLRQKSSIGRISPSDGNLESWDSEIFFTKKITGCPKKNASLFKRTGILLIYNKFIRKLTKNNKNCLIYLFIFKMATSGVDTLLQTLWEIVYRSINHILVDSIPCSNQALLQRLNRLVGLRHASAFRMLHNE